MGPGPRAITTPEAREHALNTPTQTMLDFGSIILPEAALDGYDLSLVSHADSVLDTLLVQSDSGRRAFTVYATPRSGGWDPGLDEANQRQAIAAGARHMLARRGPYGRELMATLSDGSHVTYTSVLGDRWTMRVVTRSAAEREFIETQRTRHLISQMILDRGGHAWPPGTPLPISVPEGWDES